MTLVPRIVTLLNERDAGRLLFVVDGTIPSQDIPELRAQGVAEVVIPGATTQAIVDFIQGAVGDRTTG
jgi:methylmalonyl-CoA mutase, C-terminal domain